MPRKMIVKGRDRLKYFPAVVGPVVCVILPGSVYCKVVLGLDTAERIITGRMCCAQLSVVLNHLGGNDRWSVSSRPATVRAK